MPKCPEWTQEWEHKWINKLVVPVDWFFALPHDTRQELIDANPDVINGALSEYFG